MGTCMGIYLPTDLRTTPGLIGESYARPCLGMFAWLLKQLKNETWRKQIGAVTWHRNWKLEHVGTEPRYFEP